MIGDPVRLRAALENLIDNAVKFTEQGGVVLTASAVRGAKGKAGVAFAVSDSGIGLTMAEIKRLFRPFSPSQCQHRLALRRRGVLDCRRSSNSRVRWAATSPSRRGEAAERPLR